MYCEGEMADLNTSTINSALGEGSSPLMDMKTDLNVEYEGRFEC